MNGSSSGIPLGVVVFHDKTGGVPTRFVVKYSKTNVL
jgi:hypothetical protein